MTNVKNSITLTSYAKLNYTLDVLSRRADGYHNLASIMQTISLSDEIVLTRCAEPGIMLECDAPAIPSDARNLAYRAAEAALRAAGCAGGLHIRLSKHIPSQAGLGGGSSNAAYTLRGVNELYSLGLSDARLLELAAELGSDVPFFLVGGTAAARGRGEALTPLPDGPPFWFVIVKPETNVSTAWAYGALDANPERISARSTRQMEEVLRSGDMARAAARMTNDFEQVVFEEHLSIALLHEEFMMARARHARLCGSGSAVFGVLFEQAEAEETARILRLKYRDVFTCRAITGEEALTWKL